MSRLKCEALRHAVKTPLLANSLGSIANLKVKSLLRENEAFIQLIILEINEQKCFVRIYGNLGK